MKMHIKKTVAYIMMAVMILSICGSVPTAETKAAEFDGDVIENPWEDLFKDDDNQNIDIDNDNNKKPPVVVGGDSDQDKDAIKKLQEAIRTKVISASKSNKKSKKAKIVLKKIKKAKGYQVKYSTNKKFKKSKTKIKTFKKNRFVLKNLKKGRKYYIKARAYAKVNGRKVYGAWSKRAVIRVKKKKAVKRK